MLLDEPLVSADQVGPSSSRSRWHSLLLGAAALSAAGLCGALALCAAPVVGRPGVVALAEPREHHNEHWPLQLSASEDFVREWAALCQRHAAQISVGGALVMVSVFFLASVPWGVSGFANMALTMKIPQPGLVGTVSFIVVVFSSLSVVCGLATDWVGVTVAGAKVLIIILIIMSWALHHEVIFPPDRGLVARTNIGVVKKSHNQEGFCKNVSLVGCLLVLIGNELAMPQTSGICDMGRLLTIFAFVRFGVRGYIDRAKHKHYRFPSSVGVLAWLFTQLGAWLVVLGPILPKTWTVGPFATREVATIVGAKMMIISLVVTSYSGHWKCYRRAAAAEAKDEQYYHKLSLQKNISIAGGFVMIIGFHLPHL